MKLIFLLIMLCSSLASATISSGVIQSSNGSAITSQTNGSQQALDVGIDVSGVQVDPRTRTWSLLNTTDSVTSYEGGSPWSFNLTQISGTALTFGQQLMASSLPVVLSSNQTGINSFLDKNQTGKISALNGSVAIATNGMSSVIITVTGTWVANLEFQGFDGTNWVLTAGLTQPAGGITEALSSNGTVLINSGGYSQIRILANLYTSGTANIYMNAGAGPALQEVYNDSGAPLIDRLYDNTTSNYFTIKSASTAPAATDTAIVVGLSPNGNQATAALQTTGNASLASIDAGIPAALGVTTGSASMPVVLASDQFSNYSGTPTQTSVSCGTTSTTLLAASTATKFISVRNPTTSTQTVWINIAGAAATAAAPSIDLAPGSEADYNLGPDSYLPTSGLTCIATTASTVTLVYK